MEKALKIMNQMQPRKIELGAIEDLRQSIKNVEAYKREIDGFITRYKEIKGELNQYEKNREQLVREAQNAIFKSGVPLMLCKNNLQTLEQIRTIARKLRFGKRPLWRLLTQYKN